MFFGQKELKLVLIFIILINAYKYKIFKFLSNNIEFFLCFRVQENHSSLNDFKNENTVFNFTEFEIVSTTEKYNITPEQLASSYFGDITGQLG